MLITRVEFERRSRCIGKARKCNSELCLHMEQNAKFSFKSSMNVNEIQNLSGIEVFQ